MTVIEIDTESIVKIKNELKRANTIEDEYKKDGMYDEAVRMNTYQAGILSALKMLGIEGKK